jgi:hypothetical protein
MRLLLCLAILLTSLPAMSQLDTGLQDQLVKMAEQNQQVSQSLDKYDPENIPLTLQSVATEINNIHTQTLKEIVTLYGWPSKKQIGEKGIKAAFILIKHSNDLAFQQDMLPLIIQSYIDKEGIAGQDVAQFTDNLSIKLGKKQVFGTQAKLIDGKVVFAPIQNMETVDPLRAQMGMSSLLEYKQILKAFDGL